MNLLLKILFQDIDPSKRHYYEVICENTPCKLYFDIEYKKELNKSVNGDQLLKIFIELLIFDLRNSFDVSDINENEHIINLISSTESKFSHHIIVNHPRLIFVNNYSAGKYAKYICEKLRNMPEMIIINDQNYDPTKASQKTTRYGTFIDEGVYTKNRNFRLYLSSKYNKNVQLKQFCAANKSEKSTFLDSLVSSQRNKENILKLKTQLITFEYDDHQTMPRINRMSTNLLINSSNYERYSFSYLLRYNRTTVKNTNRLCN